MAVDRDLIKRASDYVSETLVLPLEAEVYRMPQAEKAPFLRKTLDKSRRRRYSLDEVNAVGAAADFTSLAAQAIVPDDVTKTLDESFSQMLLRKIDESGMKDSECYKKANVDRKLFSKIRSDRTYRPSKQTALCFIFALALPIDEANEMLMKAGYALSHSIKFDVVIEFFIINGIYDLTTVNEVLYEFDLPLLGV